MEVSAVTITIRYGLRWMTFTPTAYTTSEGVQDAFALTESGRACVGEVEDEMDLSAERLASAIIAL